jgi:hypothetical protein
MGDQVLVRLCVNRSVENSLMGDSVLVRVPVKRCMCGFGGGSLTGDGVLGGVRGAFSDGGWCTWRVLVRLSVDRRVEDCLMGVGNLVEYSSCVGFGGFSGDGVLTIHVVVLQDSVGDWIFVG